MKNTSQSFQNHGQINNGLCCIQMRPYFKFIYYKQIQLTKTLAQTKISKIFKNSMHNNHQTNKIDASENKVR